LRGQASRFEVFRKREAQAAARLPRGNDHQQMIQRSDAAGRRPGLAGQPVGDGRNQRRAAIEKDAFHRRR